MKKLRSSKLWKNSKGIGQVKKTERLVFFYDLSIVAERTFKAPKANFGQKSF
jgi:hypothetical protein